MLNRIVQISLVFGVAILFSCTSAPSSEDVAAEASVAEPQYWVPEGDTILFQTNSSNDRGSFSKTWSGFYDPGEHIAIEMYPDSGGEGLVFGLMLIVEQSSFFTLAVDTQGRYNYLTADHEPMGGSEWREYESFEPGTMVRLSAQRGADGWSLYINDENVGVLSGFPSRVQYGVMLYPAYGLSNAQMERFPEEPIRFRYRVTEEG